MYSVAFLNIFFMVQYIINSLLSGVGRIKMLLSELTALVKWTPIFFLQI
jgi:hypothetical protein